MQQSLSLRWPEKVAVASPGPLRLLQLQQQIQQHVVPHAGSAYELGAGGAMVAHGLRDATNDADVSVSPEVWQAMHEAHGKPEVLTYGTTRHFVVPGTAVDIHEGMGPATRVDAAGLQVPSHQDLLAFYEGLNRPKDQQWIQLLRNAKTAKDLNFTPMPHQTALSDKLDDESGQLVFHGLGSGKTKSIVNAAHEHGLPLVAIVPAALRDNMRKELHTSGFKQPSMVLSYEEALKKMKDPAFLEHASKSLVAFDEAHRGSSEIGQRRKLLANLPAAKKLLATATPARNDPAELAPLINSIEPGSLPNKATDFNNQFIDTHTKPVGFFGWLTGQKGEKVKQPKNLHEFEKAVKGKVDFYQAADRSQYPSFDEKIVEVPMAPKQQAAYDMTMGKYPMLWYKIKHGLPTSKRDESDFKAFMSGPRQVMNHPGPYNSSATDKDAPKITAAVDEIEKRRKKDKNFRGVAYSAYLDTGVHPLSRELDRRGIPHAMFTGEQDEGERKHIVEAYNKGKLPVLLISGAGSEGLDLKGTKLMQILEPHWNEELVDQVRGRAIRYKSHTHLPPDERHVEVQRFHAVPAASWMDRLLGRKRSSESSADEYLYNKAQEKRETLRPFLEILKGRPASEVEAEMKQAADAAPGAIMCDTKWNLPGILLDLDGTLVHTQGPWGPGVLGTQQVLPRRIETLRMLKARGYKLIGITNRSAHYQSMDEMTLMKLNQETMEVTEHLLDDILCCPDGDPRIQKPSPTMLLQAMQQYRLDPENTVMVGDAPADEGAAENAGVPFVFADAFFTADWSKVPFAVPHPAPEVLGSHRWVADSVGNLVGTMACCGQEAVNALRKKIELYCHDQDITTPEMIVADEVLKLKVPEALDTLAAWIDNVYEERDAGLAFESP